MTRDEERRKLRDMLLEGGNSPPGPVADEAYFAELRKLAWSSENAEAIRSSNEYVERNGLPLERHRQF